MSKPFKITYAPRAIEDIRALRAFDRTKVVKAIEQYLTHESTQVSKSRIKRFEEPFWCQFRLRIDASGAYYNVNEMSHDVSILRVLRKETEQTPPEAP